MFDLFDILDLFDLLDIFDKRIHFFISLMNKEKQFGLSPLPKDTLLPCAASPTDAQTGGKFPFVCNRLGFRARKTHKSFVTTRKTI